MSECGGGTDQALEDDPTELAPGYCRTLLDAIDDGVVVLQADGMLSYADDRAREILGEALDTLVGSGDVASHLDPVDASGDPLAVDDLPFARVREDGTSVTDRTVGIRRPSGERVWLSIDGAPHRSPDGDLDGAVFAVEDVTDRRNVEHELEAVLGRVTDAFYALDDQWRFTHVNERAEELIDYTGEGLVGENIWKVFEWGADSRLREEYERAMDTQESTSFELYYPEPLDSWYEVTAYPSETGLSVYFRDVTDRKVQERKRRESEQRYRTLVDNFPNGAVGLFDEDLRYRVAGGDAFDDVGLSPDEVVGETIWERYPDEVADTVAEHFRAALGGERRTFELEFHDRHWHVHALPVEDDDGAVTDGLVMVQDVTDRKAVEQELREREATFRMVAENIDEIVWMTSADASEFKYVNPAYEDVWGQERETLYRDSTAFAELLHPEDRDRVLESWSDLPEEPYEEEFRVVTPDGDVRWVHAQATRVHDESGDVTRVVGVASDVTDRVERERALEQSERRYRTLAEHFPNGAVGVYDEDLRYTLAAGSELGETLPSSDNLEGERMSDLFPDDTVADLEPVFRAAIEDGETVDTTTEYDGRTWRVWATPLTDAAGETFAGLSFTQDVTDRVERERRLEELVEKLEESNERLEQFAYAASHDLQEPLRMVSCYLRLLDRRYGDALDEDGREFLAFAVDGAERMREMIDGLLEYSRVETRGDPFEPVDLNDVLAAVRNDLQLMIEEHDAEITVEELPRLEGDPSQLHQVFQNLLENAIRYSGDDPPRVYVSAERDGDRWILSVSDDGIGIAPEDHDQIFEVFNRLHSREEYDGAGIGLALCERIVERHGGDVRIDSAPGEGTTVSVRLPVIRETDV